MIPSHCGLDIHSFIIPINSSILPTTAITQVNYPIRIHEADCCKCLRINKKILKIKVKENHKIVYILEKMWKDVNYDQFPNIILITDEINSKNNDMAKLVLRQLFQDSISTRKLVKKYFEQYEWSLTSSTQVRSIVKNMTTICFCKDNLIIDKTTCNSGFIIIGTENQMKTISHCFNKYCQKTEYTKAYVIKMSNVDMVAKNQKGFNMSLLSTSNEKILLDNTLYTLVGEEKNGNNKHSPTYTFPFGKREWFNEIRESSFECAKRELYEELNIQFSSNIWAQSQLTNRPQYIHRSGIMLFFLHLTPNANIKYHDKSDTIYLDC